MSEPSPTAPASESPRPVDFALGSPPNTVGWGRRLWTACVALAKYLVGALLTQSLVGSVLILGWTMRVMQRASFKAWWKRSQNRTLDPRFAAWLKSQSPLHPHRHWPNWCLENNFVTARRARAAALPERRWRGWFQGWFRSLTLNLRLGLQGAFNVLVLTLPGAVLLLFSWYDGWNNSFNKGYEQAPVGPLTGILGILLFIGAMLYVPMAQARQAATGDWRAFYQFRLVWNLVVRHWPKCLLLAAGYSLLALPLAILKTAPYFFAHNNPTVAQWTPEQVVDYLNTYFFRCGLVVFPLWVLLRIAAARIYGRAILYDLQHGELPVAALGEQERQALQALDLIQVHPPRSRHVLLRVAQKTSATAFRVAGITAIAFVWFTFVAQLYISQFFHYHPIHPWLNQPLAQLPWFRYVPFHAQNPVPEFFLALLLIATFYVFSWFLHGLRHFLARTSSQVTASG